MRKSYEVRLYPNSAWKKYKLEKKISVWKALEEKKFFFCILDLKKHNFETIAEIINSHWTLANITLSIY